MNSKRYVQKIVKYYIWLGIMIIGVFFNDNVSAKTSQRMEVDSLIQVLPTLSNLSRVKVLNRLTWKLRNTDLDSAQRFGEEAIHLAEQLEAWKELVDAYSFTGIVLRNKGNYIYALNYFYQALHLSEKHNFTLNTAYSYNNIGDALGKQGKNQEARENILKAIPFFQKSQNKRGEAYGYIRLGEIYQEDSLYLEALEAYRRCLGIRLETTRDTAGILAVENRIGQIHELTQNYDSALLYYHHSLYLSETMPQPLGIAGNTNYLASVHYQLHDHDSAIYYAKKSLQVANKVGVNRVIRRNAKLLAKIYSQRENYQKAYEMTRIFSEAHAKLMREKTNKTMKSLHIEYQVQKQESKIKLLNKDKDFWQLFTWALIIGAVLLVGLLIFMVWVARQRRKGYQKLSEQKEEIEQQTEKLTEANIAVQAQKEVWEHKNKTLEKALEELKTAQTKIAKSEQMASLGQMVTGISHELSNPINFVYTGTESLQTILKDLTEILDKYDQADKISPEQLTDFQEEILELKEDLEYQEMQEDTFLLLKDIHHGATQTANVITSLRTFARMDSKMAISTDIHQSLDSTLVILNRKLEDRIEVKKKYQKNLPFVTCFSGQINQVFMNILLNAFEAIEGEGKVEIRTELTDNEKVKISISDNGKGIDMKTQKNIFDTFFTTKNTESHKGLGLSITTDILQRHQGKIEVESHKNQGTTVIVILPIHPKLEV